MTIEIVKGVARHRCERCKKLVKKGKKPYAFIDNDNTVHHFCNRNQFVKWYDDRHQLRLFDWGAVEGIYID